MTKVTALSSPTVLVHSVQFPKSGPWLRVSRGQDSRKSPEANENAWNRDVLKFSKNFGAPRAFGVAAGLFPVKHPGAGVDFHDQ